MDNSIYDEVIMLSHCVETVWDHAPFFWMLDVIHMVKTAANCSRVQQCK